MIKINITDSSPILCISTVRLFVGDDSEIICPEKTKLVVWSIASLPIKQCK